jgi:hypothetical protein
MRASGLGAAPDKRVSITDVLSVPRLFERHEASRTLTFCEFEEAIGEHAPSDSLRAVAVDME